MTMNSLLSFASCCLMVAGYLAQGSTEPPIFMASTPSPAPCANCSYAGYCHNLANGTLECVCNDGFSGNHCQVCHVCHNAALSCSTTSEGDPNCLCLPLTLGDRCEMYNGDNTSTSPDNIALNKQVIHCKSGAQGIDLANSSIWSTDVCYNLTTDNVMIVDLEGIYNVRNITIAAWDQTYAGRNVSVSVGWHLGEGCSVTNETHCANYVGVWNGSTKGSPCSTTTTGRYIRIENIKNGTANICIHRASGIRIRQTIQQAKFSNTFYPLGLRVSSFKDLPAVSNLSCARWCLQHPICLNFRWTDGTCFLYGGPPGGINPVTAYRYQGNV